MKVRRGERTLLWFLRIASLLMLIPAIAMTVYGYRMEDYFVMTMNMLLSITLGGIMYVEWFVLEVGGDEEDGAR